MFKHLTIKSVFLVLAIAFSSGCSYLALDTLDDDYLDKKYSTPQTEYIEFEGGKLRVEDTGEGPVLVLLHGLMANYKAWDRWMPGLTGYRVVRMDLPGWGLSDTPTPKSYDPKVHERAVLHVLKTKGINKATLIGHSFGAYTAWNLAADYPQLVERLVIVNGLSFPQDTRFDAKLLGWPLIEQGAWFTSPKPIVNYAIDTMLVDDDTLTVEERDMYFEFLRSDGGQRVMAEAINWYTDYPRKGAEPDPRLTSLTLPLITFWGAQDVWTSYEQAGKQWPQYYPDANHVVFQDAGHLVVDEKADESLKYLLRFLKSTNAELGYSVKSDTTSGETNSK